MIIPTILLILAAIVMGVLHFIKKKLSFWEELGAPYVKPNGFFGNLKGVGVAEHTYQRMERFYKEYKGKVPFIGIYFFLKPTALLLDIELVKKVLVKDFDYFVDRGVYFNEKNDPISAHLFSIYGSKWKTLRSKLTPTFTSGKMKYMFPTIIEIGERLEARIGQLSEQNDEIEMKNMLARYTTDVIGSCAFGLECNSLNDKNAQFREMGIKVFDKPRHSLPFTLMLSSCRRFAQMLGIKMFRDDVSEFFTKAVTDTVEYRTVNGVSRRDFLNIIMELRKDEELKGGPITIDEMVAQAFIFFLAGFETSSTLLTFCLYQLSLNQDIQDRLRQHIEEVLVQHNGKFTYEAMMDMKYVDQVLKESLRMYPPLSMLFRVCTKDYKIPDTNYIFKKDTLMAIPAHSIQHDSEYYPNPDTFNPDNFSAEKENARNPMTFLAFGEGPRVCIGERFGMMQARIGLVSLIRKYKLSIGSKLQTPVKILPGSIILSPDGGMWIKVRPVK